jgi:hypothetical protein
MNMRKKSSKSDSAAYEVGYRRPPKQHQFQKGRSGNPTGTNRKPARSPDFKASLERDLSALRPAAIGPAPSAFRARACTWS